MTADDWYGRGLAALESGDAGLAAHAQREALKLDPDHAAARAHLAAALQLLGDDDGAAAQLEELARRLGPNVALTARTLQLREAASIARARRLVGAPLERVAQSPLVRSAMARTLTGTSFRAPFGELTVGPRRLELVFDAMDASMGRSDLSYGGTTEEEDGRRVPLDEFSAAGIVFLSEALGIAPVAARRLLSYMLTPEHGLGPHRFAGCDVGWTVQEVELTRRYGLFVEAT